MSQPREIVLHIHTRTDKLPTPSEIEKTITEFLEENHLLRDQWGIKNAVTVPYSVFLGLWESSVTTIVIERKAD